MSYILDALRRAQAQRERGSVPDIHVLPQGTGAPLPAPSRAGSPLLWAEVGVVLVAAMLLAWWLLGQREPARDVVTMAPAPGAMPAPPSGVAPPVLAQPVAPSALPTPVQLPPPAAPVPPAVAVAVAVAPAPAPLPTVAVAPSTALVAPASSVAKELKIVAPAQRSGPATAPAAQPVPAPAPAPAVAPAAAVNEPRVYTRDELPSDIRGQLPQVKISGSSYSESPSSRMLIANGQVFYENEKIAPDTTLVQIRPNSAILSFRGFRYAVPF